MKLFNLAIMLLMTTVLTHCRTDRVIGGDTGFLALEITPAEPFNPVARHGEITRYKVTVATAGLPTPVVRYYGNDETEAEIDGLPAGSLAIVTVEYLNVNELTVRRGISPEIPIVGGEFAEAKIVVNNVPIFANVRDGAIIPANMFRPFVFAPEGMEIVLSDETGGVSRSVADVATEISVFTAPQAPQEELVGINMGLLLPGEHRLTVSSLTTGESSSVSVTIVNSVAASVLPTTAGDYFGTLPGSSVSEGFGLLETQRVLIGE